MKKFHCKFYPNLPFFILNFKLIFFSVYEHEIEKKSVVLYFRKHTYTIKLHKIKSL